MKKIKSPITGSIILIAILSFLTFLPFSNKLGFYFNDWHPILSRLTNTSLLTLFRIDRPVLGLIYPITTSILGDNPFAWQLFVILLRTISAVVFYTILYQIWPTYWKQSTIMAVLMALYPGFMQQPIALTFSNHFIGVILGLLSISLSIYICRLPKTSNGKRLFLILLSLGFELSYLVIYEYMIGFELVRWILIWYYLFPNSLLRIKQNFFQWLKQISYYLLPLGFFLIIRIFIFKSGRQTTDIGYLIGTYLDQPIQMIGKIMVEFFHAIINTTIFAWFVPLYNSIEFINIKDLIIASLIGIIAVVLISQFISKFRPPTDFIDSNNRDWRLDSTILGLIFIIVTLLPIIITNREIAFRDLLDRYTLQSAFGVAMLIVGMANLLLTEKIKYFFICTLLFFSVLFQVSNNVNWSKNWEIQRQLFWQLAWRAPQIQPGTVGMVLQPKGFLFREDEDFYAPANLIYYPNEGSLQIVSEVFNDDTARNIYFQDITYRNYRTVQFSRDFSKTLIISNSSGNSCVHFIDGEKPELTSGETSLIRLVAPYSKIDQIIAEGESPIPPYYPFGLEPDHGWCYYYQKANLARQNQAWSEIHLLWKKVQENGLLPIDPSEWMPFIEAFAVTDELDQVSSPITEVRNNPSVWMNICKNYDGSQRDLLNWELKLNEQLCAE